MPAAETATLTDAPQQPDAMVRAARAAALAGLLGLIVLGLTIKVLPLALCVLGLLRHRMYTFRWLSLLVWLYFMEGVVRATTEQGWSRALAVVEIGLCLLLFTSSALYIRWRLRHAAPAAA